MSVLNGKQILLGVTGSIAAYKACEIVRLLRKDDAEVQVMMTRSGTKMVGQATFAALSGKKVLTDLFPDTPEAGLEHIHLSETMDAIVVAPATANTIAKAAQGIADDLLSTTLLASELPTLFAPAMNFRMLKKQSTQENIKTLKKRDVTIVDPEYGLLASLAPGEGRMAEPETIVSTLRQLLGTPQDYSRKRILVTAGPTQEPIDSIRFISNRSSGKMGYAIAQAAVDRGASVTLISGPTYIDPPASCEVIAVKTAHEMNQVVRKAAHNQNVIIMAAAVGDFRPVEIEESKIKRTEGSLVLQLEPTLDILKGLREITDAVLVGFALELEHGEENARRKLNEKQLDAIILNYANKPGSGFDSDTNEGVLFFKDLEKKISLPLESKDRMAHRILSEIQPILPKRTKEVTPENN